MAKIVAFTVPSIDAGYEALDELAGASDVQDVALVYKNEVGRVKIQQTSDVSAGRGAFRGPLLGAAVSLFAGPLVGVAAAGAAGGGALAALGDRGVDNRLLKLAGKQLETGHPAVFVMASDATADEIAARVRRLANLKQYQGQIEVADFPAEAQEFIKEQIKTERAAATESPEQETTASSGQATAAPTTAA